MLVVKLELWPQGEEERSKLLGQVIICNDGTGDPGIGNYRFSLLKGSNWKQPARKVFEGEIKNFPRMEKDAFDLLYRALRAAVGDPCREAEAND